MGQGYSERVKNHWLDKAAIASLFHSPSFLLFHSSRASARTFSPPFPHRFHFSILISRHRLSRERVPIIFPIFIAKALKKSLFHRRFFIISPDNFRLENLRPNSSLDRTRIPIGWIRSTVTVVSCRGDRVYVPGVLREED